jgi:hypothetical protein
MDAEAMNVDAEARSPEPPGAAAPLAEPSLPGTSVHGTANATTPVSAFIGVYHADGGLVGEVRHVIGSWLGTAHCSLCDITHSPVRRKRAWDRMVAGLGVPFELHHLNELTPDVAEAVARLGSPVVLARLADGHVVQVLGPDVLESLDGSVAEFERALRAAVGAI